MIRTTLLTALFIGAIFMEAVVAQSNTTDTEAGTSSGDAEVSTATTEPVTTTSAAVSPTPAFVMFASFLFVSVARNLL